MPDATLVFSTSTPLAPIMVDFGSAQDRCEADHRDGGPCQTRLLPDGRCPMVNGHAVQSTEGDCQTCLNLAEPWRKFGIALEDVQPAHGWRICCDVLECAEHLARFTCQWCGE